MCVLCQYQSMYISYCIKKIKYFTNIFIYYKYIYFGLVSGEFQIWIDNIHILSIIHNIIHKIKKKKPLIWVYLSQ
jgi:hypothetical protein